MNNLETLKQELKTQKQEIENKGGTVQVLNTNPSPFEITEGIKTIPVVDFSLADATEENVDEGKTFYSVNSALKVGTKKQTDFTLANATEEDVVAGKTFYATNNVLKTGTKKDLSTIIGPLFEYIPNNQTYSEVFDYYLPTHITSVRYAFLQNNPNKVNFHFHPDITDIGGYAFQATTSFNFSDFAELTKLTHIKAYAFDGSNPEGIELANLPSIIKNIEARAFQNCVKENAIINMPKSCTNLGTYIFYCANRVNAKEINFPLDMSLVSLSSNFMYNISFDCDLVTPASISSILSKCNYNGSFNNIHFLGTINNLADRCFGADDTLALSEIKLKTITFEQTTPPKTVGTAVFSSQAVENGLKIYVPDESIEAYIDKFSTDYSSCFYPMSQKE